MGFYDVQHKRMIVGVDGGTAVSQGANPDCPDHLPPEARAVWNRVVPNLARSGILSEVDVVQLGNLCYAQAVLEKLQWDFWEQGPWHRDKHGRLVLNPLGTAIHRQTVQVNRLSSEFGLTPRARAVLGDSLRSGLSDYAAQQSSDETPGVCRPSPRSQPIQ